MRVVRTRAELREARAALKGSVGFVPTMGALHEGHASLVRRAREASDNVVASIFVNPTQFGPNEDLSRYPRDEAVDLALLERLGVDLAFLPGVEDIYPAGAAITVDVGRLGEVLEGAARPGHFRGVATVVTILFGLVQPTRAFFGQKDGQQAVVVRRLVRDLGLPLEIEICPTVREPDGLAMSSRNRYLTPSERGEAPILYRTLWLAEALAGADVTVDDVRERMQQELAMLRLGSPDYVSVADPHTLEELDGRLIGPALASLAVRFPSARLIDCLPIFGVGTEDHFQPT